MSDNRQQLTELIREEAVNPHHSVSVITDKLMQEQAVLVKEWLDEHTRLMLSGWVSDILRWDRIAERKRTPLEEVLERAASGLSLYDLSYPVNDDNLRKTLGEMRGKDHLYVSESYKTQSQTMSTYSDLHKTLALEVGKKMTRTVYTETALRDLFTEYEDKI